MTTTAERRAGQTTEGARLRALKAARVRDGNLGCEACGWAPPAVLADVGHVNAWTMMHAHHVVPVAAGGSHALANLVVLCPTCHALAHRHGSLQRPSNGDGTRGAVWYGPADRATLLEGMRLLRERPAEWPAWMRKHATEPVRRPDVSDRLGLELIDMDRRIASRRRRA